MRSVKQLLENKGSGVIGVDADDPVLTAVQAMADHHIGAVLVLRGGVLAGILSERDYARKVVLRGRSSSETQVWEIMSSPVIKRMQAGTEVSGATVTTSAVMIALTAVSAEERPCSTTLRA